MNQLRIIGGEWKRRLIRFESVEGLRPTPDRVRETLFNWLMWDVAGRRVLDLCAGSGARGLEGRSGGAAHCILIEPHKKQGQQLSATLAELKDHTQSQVINLTAQAAASRVNGLFELMFLDPPYALNLWSELARLYDSNLADGALIYVEADRALDTLDLPAHWQALKETKAGSVRAGLFQKAVR